MNNIGDTVQYTSPAYRSGGDEQGFVIRRRGVVTEICDDLLVVKLTSVFAYHPDNIDGGRFLPIGTPWKFQGKDYDPAIDVVVATAVEVIK